MPLPSLTRILAVLALATVALLAPASAAVAQDVCYPPPCAPGISDSTVVSGQTVTVTSGTGSYQPGELVEYGILSADGTDLPLGQATADASGAVRATFQMPDLPPGTYSVLFTSTVDGRQVRVPFTVPAGLAPGAGGGVVPEVREVVSGVAGKLPRTGSTELLLLAAGGTGLFVAGAGVLLSARRRRGRLV